MTYVAEHQPEDLFVFKKYLDSALTQGYYDQEQLVGNKSKLFELVHSLAWFDEPFEGMTNLHFLKTVQEDLAEFSGSRPFGALKYKLIDVIWTLVHREINNAYET